MGRRAKRQKTDNRHTNHGGEASDVQHYHYLTPSAFSPDATASIDCSQSTGFPPIFGWYTGTRSSDAPELRRPLSSGAGTHTRFFYPEESWADNHDFSATKKGVCEGRRNFVSEFGSDFASVSTELPSHDSCNLKDKAEAAAGRAYERLLTENKGVTLWKLLQSVLLVLKAESLESLGLRIHDIPTLRKILLLEGKVNSYIHCHVAVRKITTLHELALEISENEGVKHFNDLGLGSIAFLPLVKRYFSPAGASEVCKITTDDVLNHLSDYMNQSQGRIEVEEFLLFMSNARSVHSPQQLGVRIQNLGMYVSFIRREKKAEREMASQRAHLTSLKESAAKHRIQQSNITERIDAFLMSATKDNGENFSLCKRDEADKKSKPNFSTDSKEVVASTNNSKIGSCPYPSAAEERVRLLKKRVVDEYSMSNDELGDFVSAWGGACKSASISEVLLRMISQVPSESRKKKLLKIFKVHPAIELLNVAVLSMKTGHLMHRYDHEEDVDNRSHGKEEMNSPDEADRTKMMESKPQSSDSRMIKEADETSPCLMHCCETLLEVLDKVHDDVIRSINEFKEDFVKVPFDFVTSRIIQCEKLISERLPLKELRSQNFVEQYLVKLSKFFSGVTDSVQSSWTVSIPHTKIQVFISQVIRAIGDASKLSENYVFQLLVKQFHSQNIGEWCFPVIRKFMKICSEEKLSHNSIYYSCALSSSKMNRLQESQSRVYSNSMSNGNSSAQTVHNFGLNASITTSDVRRRLLKAPMLCDLLEWVHWDAIFSLCLGDFLAWLDTDASMKEVVCLVTSEGKVLRIDGSATMDRFLAAAVQGCGKESAVQLVSLIAIYGGVDQIPHSLLRSYLSKALEILTGRSHSKDKNHNACKLWMHSKSCTIDFPGKFIHNSVVALEDRKPSMFIYAFQFVMEFLSTIPSEFLVYAASIIVPVLTDIIPNAAERILDFCTVANDYMMLHRIGISLGVDEWVKDLQSSFLEYHCSNDKTVLQASAEHLDESSIMGVSEFLNSGVSSLNHACNDSPKDGEEMQTMNSHIEPITVAEMDVVYEMDILAKTGSIAPQIQGGIELEAREVIAAIRKEEFGMDLELSNGEFSLLAKQHERIGRALNCLSRELYSQDSHFVLELVQNADDNEYPPNVDAMVVFILQESRVVVVNNEVGFTSANMKALCDVGRSTKSGSGAGYIGHKGIGFKSVFRITDSPEIHSRGFHVKFDISDGNIGFILPTVIEPFVDWDSIEELLTDVENRTNHGKQIWNTCMVLPLKSSRMSESDVGMLSIKLNDIRPSLLLFLHRLCCITVKDDLCGSLRIMQRDNLEDCFVKVSDNGHDSYWLVVKEELNAIVDRPGVEKTEIALAFPLKLSDGSFDACNEHQEVFSFLPLRSYGLRFIIQGDFILPSSREEIDADSAWNQWLLSEIPRVCLKAVEILKDADCFKQNPGKATAIFMSYVPVEGEAHGFFYPLPQMILSCLRSSQCLPVEGRKAQWALPCAVLGGWDESSRKLIPDNLLQTLLGLHYLHRDVVIAPALAAELGIQSYGMKLLIDFMECLCTQKDYLTELGPKWIRAWLTALYNCYINESQKKLNFFQRKSGVEDLERVKRLPFIPLLNGSYTSITDSPVWLPCSEGSTGNEITTLLEYFPLLYAELRTVHPLLVNSPSDACDDTIAISGLERENTSLVCLMLEELGVGQMSGHKVVTTHILPVMVSDEIWQKSRSLVMQYLAFVMLHHESKCNDCKSDGWNLMSELRKNAVLVTDDGYKRIDQETVHFGVGFRSPVNVKAILKDIGIKWNEVDPAYISIYQSWTADVSCMKWRAFLKELGVSDFVKLEHSCRKLKDSHTENGIDVGNMEDWESAELVKILESLCSSNLSLPARRLLSSHVLSAFDLLWDEYYSKCFSGDCSIMSTFIVSLRSFPWVQSSFDQNLYHPTELFCLSPAIELILGRNAPYTVPEIKSKMLSTALGLRNSLTVSAVVSVLRSWNQQSIRLSLAQMTRLYSFLWNEMPSHKDDLLEFLESEAYIFVPEVTNNSDITVPVPGNFFHRKDVIWKDETGCLELLLKTFSTDCISEMKLRHQPLKLIYPALHGFFVEQCCVQDTPNFKDYYNILKLLSEAYSPHEILSQVLEIIGIWSNDIKTGFMNQDDLSELKSLLRRRESQILPTVQDKWVSLHESEGIVCWCDDETVGQYFSKSKDVFYVRVTCINSKDSTIDDDSGGHKLSWFLQAMEIFPLSKVVVREPIVYGARNNEELLDLLNWALPYAQRYLQRWHNDIYINLQQTGFQTKLDRVQCITCEQLFYRYKLPGVANAVTERFECSCLLEDDVFYATRLDDLSRLFLEFSQLFFHKAPNLQLAIFLHLIALSERSGGGEPEIEAMVSAQGIRQLAEQEDGWELGMGEGEVEEKRKQEKKVARKIKRKAARAAADNDSKCEWPPEESQFLEDPQRERIEACQISLDCVMEEIKSSKKKKQQKQLEVGGSNEQTELLEGESVISSMLEENGRWWNRDEQQEREKLCIGGRPDQEKQQMLTGRLGEAVVYKYLLKKHGEDKVRWVNEDAETGLPYDMVVETGSGGEMLVEVKTTWSKDKDWFELSCSEWEAACKGGDKYVVVRVFLGAKAAAAPTSSPQLLWLPNLVSLCRDRTLKLALILPPQQPAAPQQQQPWYRNRRRRLRDVAE